MRERDPRVPDAVEDYLIALLAAAGAFGGQLGGAIGGGGAGSVGGGRGGARGGTWAARRLSTVVAEVSGVSRVDPDDAMGALRARWPKAVELPAAGVLRLVIPLGRTGLQRVVVDLDHPEGQPDHVRIRAYAKEGALSRKPTARVADAVRAVLCD